MYDEKCLELAQEFLSDHTAAINTEANQHELAQLIQTTIEDFISAKEDE
jgi:hypothetical protein